MTTSLSVGTWQSWGAVNTLNATELFTQAIKTANSLCRLRHGRRVGLGQGGAGHAGRKGHGAPVGLQPAPVLRGAAVQCNVQPAGPCSRQPNNSPSGP